MSEECCGPNEPRKPGTVRRIELSRPLSTGDACCAAEPSSKTAAPSAVHDAGDACCGPDLATTPTEADEEPEVRPPWWRMRPQATGSPFASKDALRARGYRWDAERKVWHTLVGNQAALDAECEWLKKDVYGGRSARIDIERQTALERFSSRPGEALQRDL